MADLNYMNPAAFMPGNDFKASGPLGGVMWGQQSDDYRQMMEQQMFLQELAKRRALVETQQKEADVPFLDLQRQGKMNTLQGTNPLAQELGRTTSARDIAANQYDTRVKLGPENQQLDLAKIVQGQDEIKQKKFLTSVVQAGEIANRASELAKSNPTAAIGYVQQQIAQAKAAGIEIPMEVSNPQMWGALRQAGINSMQHLQKMEETRAEVAGRERVANIEANATVQAANARGAAAAERPQSEAQMFTRISNIPKDKRTPEQNQFHFSHVAGKWADDSPALLMAEMTKPKGQPRKTNDQLRDEFFQMYGYEKGANTPIRNPAGVTDFPGAATQGSPPSGVITREEVLKAGHPYEPEKYDYRRGPNNSIQRSPKAR